jgi:hypothetical protein
VIIEFASIAEFYGSTASKYEARRRSREYDYGVMWTEPGDARRRGWRITWIAATDEMIAVRLTDGIVRILGAIGDDQRPALDGWADACLAGEPYTWIMHRLPVLLEPSDRARARPAVRRFRS